MNHLMRVIFSIASLALLSNCLSRDTSKEITKKNTPVEEIATKEAPVKEYSDMDKLLDGTGYAPKSTELNMLSEDGESESRAALRDIVEGKVIRVYEDFCVGKCLENYKKLSDRTMLKKINHDGYNAWKTSLVGLHYKKVYSDSFLKEEIGAFISNSPYLVRIGDEFYTNEDWDVDFKDYYDEQGGGRYGSHSFAMVDGYKYRAIWIHQLKKFVYIKQESDFMELAGNYHYSKPCTGDIYYDFLDTAILYDENDKPVTKKDFEGLLRIGFEAKEDHINFHFYDARRPMISNRFSEDVIIRPEYLLSYYGYDKEIVYKMYKKDILNKDNKVNFYVMIFYLILNDLLTNFAHYMLVANKTREMAVISGSFSFNGKKLLLNLDDKNLKKGERSRLLDQLLGAQSLELE